MLLLESITVIIVLLLAASFAWLFLKGAGWLVWQWLADLSVDI